MTEDKNRLKNPIEVGGLKVKIPLIRIEVIGKDKKVVKTPNGEIAYVRDDYNGLLALLNHFDSRLHVMKDYKVFIKVRDKVQEAWLKDWTELELSLDEAAFLKEYFKNLNEKDGANTQLQQFEIRTLVGVLEALG